MAHRSQLPGAISTSVQDPVADMEMTNITLQDQDIDCGSSDDVQADENHLQKLKELFEQNAGLITPGCRDTIDSILSKYGAVRNEVEQDPRIGLVLSAEFDITPTQQSFPLLSDEGVERPLDEESGGLVGDRKAPYLGGSHLDVVRDSMVDYTDYVLKAASSTLNDSSSLIENDSAVPGDCSDGYLTQDTEMTWDDREHTHLNIYADLDIGLFRDEAGLNRHVHADQVAKTAEATELVHGERQDKFLALNFLTMSPVVQVATSDSPMVVFTGRAVANELSASSGNSHCLPRHLVLASDAGQARFTRPSSPTERVDATSAPKSVTSMNDTIATRDAHESVDGGSHIESLMPEDSASNIVVSREYLETFRKRSEKVIERSVLGYDAADLLGYVPECLQDDVEKWLERVGDDDRLHAIAPPFFAWLEQDSAAEHVLNAGMAVAFAAVAIAGHLFW